LPNDGPHIEDVQGRRAEFGPFYLTRFFWIDVYSVCKLLDEFGGIKSWFGWVDRLPQTLYILLKNTKDGA